MNRLLSSYLAHSGERQNHRYIRKIKDGTRTRYFYSEQEWNAYLKNRNRPKTQADVDKERRDVQFNLNKAAAELRKNKEALASDKKQRDWNASVLKSYENEHKANLERQAKDPNYKYSKQDRMILEGGIQDLRETDKEWNEWIKQREKNVNKSKKKFSDALRDANPGRR